MMLELRVKTKSGRSEIVEQKGVYVVYLKAAPEKGKANLELVKLATKYFKKDVKLVGGMKSKKKIIEL